MATPIVTNTGVPPIPDVEVEDASLQVMLDTVKEAIEVLTGTRGNPNSRAITYGEATENGATDLFVTNRVVAAAIQTQSTITLSGDVTGAGTFNSAGAVTVGNFINLPNIVCIDGGNAAETYPGEANGPYGVLTGGGGGGAPTFGTWTPVVSDGTNDANMVNQDGIYAEIGDMVWVSCGLTMGTLASASGAARITGLPYTAYNTSAIADFPLAVGSYSSLGTDAVPFAQVENNTTYITLHKWDQVAANATSAMTVEQVSNNGTLRLSGWYRKA